MKIETILVPVDFSDDSDAAQEAALGLARKFGAKVVLLHAYHPPALMFAHYTVDPPPPTLTEIPEAAARRLDQELQKLLDAGIEAEAEVREGLAAQEICTEALERGCDLIVMGTRGRTGLSHVVLGSVAERTLRDAPCPVLTVRPS